MKEVNINTSLRHLLADVVTPVSIFLKIREQFANSILLESSDYHSKENSFSFICMDPLAEFKVDQGRCTVKLPGQEVKERPIEGENGAAARLQEFIASFQLEEGADRKAVKALRQ